MSAALKRRALISSLISRASGFAAADGSAPSDQPLWDAVQAQLAENTADRNSGTRRRQPSLLTGMLSDRDGNRMTPSHAVKKGTRYRYYVSAR